MGLRLDTMVSVGQCAPATVFLRESRCPRSFPSFVHVQHEFGISIADEE
jgi:hypothetical protein